jgi:hypothetical protein
MSQLKMARQEVGVEVCFEYQLDGETMLLGAIEILLYVSGGVNDDRSASRGISDEVRRL